MTIKKPCVHKGINKMIINFLKASFPLVKKFTHNSTTNSLSKQSYCMAKNFTSSAAPIENVQDLFDVTLINAQIGNCMLKGTLNKALNNESRKNSTSPHNLTQLWIHDVDHNLNILTPEEYIKKFFPQLINTSYMVQYSSSHLFSRYPKFHLFFLLAEPTSPQILNLYLKYINIKYELITELSKDGNNVLWPIDVSVTSNAKLIYIAPPQIETTAQKYAVDQPFKKNFQYLNVVIKQNDKVLPQHLTLPKGAVTSPAQIKDKLRRKLGLPKKKAKIKTLHSETYLANPDEMTITSTKEEGPYMRCNVNGGDSNKYYYYIDNPVFLYNFADEDGTVLLQDADPKYYASITKQMHTQNTIQQTLPKYSAFRDRLSDETFTGSYKSGFYKTKIANIPSWCTNRQITVIDQGNIPTVDYQFNPLKEATDNSNEYFFINRYIPPEIPKHPDPQYTDANPYTPTGDFPEIERIMRHITGNHEGTYQKFLNWIACLLKHKRKLQTIFLLHGTEGTGKGLFIDKVLRPLIGKNYVQQINTKHIDSRFDAWRETCLLAFLDEFKADRQQKQLIETLKGWATESYTTVEGKGSNQKKVQSFMNTIIASNEIDAIVINDADRRFHVSPRQDAKLKMVSYADTKKKIKAELTDFYFYTMFVHKHSLVDAATVELTAAKRALIEMSRSAPDRAVRALEEGDLEFFVTGMHEMTDINIPATIEAREYLKIMDKWIAQRNTTIPVARSEIGTVFHYLLWANKPQMMANAFSSYLNRASPKFADANGKKVCINGKRPMGIRMRWNLNDEDYSHLPERSTKLKAVK